MSSSKNVLLLTGGEGHDFASMAKFLRDLAERHGWKVTATEDRAVLSSLSASAYAAIVVCTQGGELTTEQGRGLVEFVKRGGGFLGIHGAAASWRGNSDYMAMLGCRLLQRVAPLEFEVEPKDAEHPVSRHIRRFQVQTELYQMEITASDHRTLLQTYWQGKIEPVVCVREFGKGRVFYISLGHTVEDFQNSEWQTLFLRALRWSTGQQEKPVPKGGVIGYGGAFNMGRHHLNAMKTVGMVPVAACDIDPARMKAAAVDFPDIQTYTNPAEMLAKSDAELLTVILPHNAHAKMVIEVLNSGRHCVVEKPMAITSDEVEAMIAAAEKNKRLLSVYHNRRWDGDFLAIEHVVTHRKMLGDIFKVEIGMSGYGSPGGWWRSHKEISGGIHYDWGAHFMYWALQLIDSPIDWVVATAQKRVWLQVSNEDHLDAYVRFKNGCILEVEASNIAKIDKPRWRILGAKGAILDRGKDAFELSLHQLGVNNESPMRVRYYPHQSIRYYENVVDHLRLDDPMEVTARKSARVIHLLHTMDRAARSGRQERVPGED
jgi:predicted dehydrogenase